MLGAKSQGFRSPVGQSMIEKNPSVNPEVNGYYSFFCQPRGKWVLQFLIQGRLNARKEQDYWKLSLLECLACPDLKYH